MKNKILDKNNWHINLIIVVLLILSILSWIYFFLSKTMIVVNTTLSTLQGDFVNADKNSPEREANVSQSDNSVKEKKIEYLDDSIDVMFDTVDSQWSVWKNDALSKIDSITTYLLSKELNSASVISGKDNWLFFDSEPDGDSISDFEGTNLYTDEEKANILEAVSKTQNELADKGIKFAVMVAPNKENVYYKSMPTTYTHANVSATDILIKYLYEGGVNIVSPKEDLLNDTDTRYYYNYDTHWNQLGGYVGVRDTLASWDLDMPELSERDIKTKNLKGNYHISALDDLAKIVGIRSYLTDDIEYEIDGTPEMDWKTVGDEQEGGQMSHFYNENAPIKESILLIGDSFRVAMIPSIREQFENVYVVNRQFYKPEMFDEANPNYILAEYVERYSYEMEDISVLLE
ncbi:MAG: hypothetical protein K6G11_04955 [Lachnospiraceae bacterium]|nr:hypothetical protein [Lachnospiraceae bacterium]